MEDYDINQLRILISSERIQHRIEELVKNRAVYGQANIACICVLKAPHSLRPILFDALVGIRDPFCTSGKLSWLYEYKWRA